MQRIKSWLKRSPPGKALYGPSFGTYIPTSTEVTSGELAMTVPEYYKCTKIISERIASMPLLMYSINTGVQDKANIYKPDRRREVIHPTLALLRKPNAWATYFTLLRTWVYHYATWGNGYIVIEVDNNGTPTGLYNRHPSDVIPYEVKQGDQYEIWYKDFTTGTIYPSDQVLHLADISDNEILGYSKVSRHAKTIGKSKAALNLVNTLFTDGAHIKYAVEYPSGEGPDSPDQIDALHKHWKNTYGGIEKSDIPAVITNGGSIKQIQADMPLGDAQYLEGEKLTSRQIRDIFGVPSIEDYASREDYMNDLHDFGLAPIMRMIVEQISTSVLLTDPTYYIKFDRHSHADLDTLGKYLTDMVRGSLMTVNEGRDLIDMPPVDGGDSIMVQANNLISLSNLDEYTKAQIEALLQTGRTLDET